MFLLINISFLALPRLNRDFEPVKRHERNVPGHDSSITLFIPVPLLRATFIYSEYTFPTISRVNRNEERGI